MKELEKPAIEQLMYIYRSFLDKGLIEELVSKAKDLYDELSVGNTLLSNIVNTAVESLFPIAYPNADPNRTVPTREEVKEIIEKLKKRKQELEE